MAKPSCRELAKDVLDGVDEGTLEITEGEVKRPGMFADAGANVSRRKSIERMNVDLVVDGRPKRSDVMVEDVL